jgi:hypothetical protein
LSSRAAEQRSNAYLAVQVLYQPVGTYRARTNWLVPDRSVPVRYLNLNAADAIRDVTTGREYSFLVNAYKPRYYYWEVRRDRCGHLHSCHSGSCKHSKQCQSIAEYVCHLVGVRARTTWGGSFA